MSNVVRFPTNTHISQIMAEEYTRDQMRLQLGACVGLLHGSPTNADLIEIIERMRVVAQHIDCMVGIKEACK